MSYQWNGSELQAHEVGERAVLTQKLLLQVSTAFNINTLSRANDLGGTYNLNVLLSSSTGHYVLRVFCIMPSSRAYHHNSLLHE